MPIDASIPLGVRIPKGTSAQDFVSRLMQSRYQREQAQALEEQRRASAEHTRLQTADLQQKDTDRRDMGAALQVGKGIRDATLAHALQTNPNVVPQLTEYFDKTETQFNAARKLRDDAKASELNALGDVMNEAIKGGGTPEVLNLHLSYAAELWPDYADKIKGIGDRLRALPDDASRVQMLKTIRGMAPAYRETASERDKRENPQPLQGSPGTQFLDPKTRQPFHTVPVKPDTPTVGSFEDYSTASPERKAQIERDRKAYQQADDRPQISVINAATSDAELKAAARNIVGNPRDLSTLRSISSLRGDQRLKLYNEIKALDPQFDPGLIDRRVKFLDSYEDPKGRSAMNRGAMNNILMHAADLSAVNEQYRRSDARLVNIPIAALKRQSGTSWTQFQVPLSVLKDEIALYFAGGYAPNKEQLATWDRIANDTATPAQIEGFAKDLIHVGLRRADTHNQQFKTMMGYDDPNLLTPDAVAAGQQLGLGAAVAKYGSGGQFGSRSQSVQAPAPSGGPAKVQRKKNSAGTWVINDGSGWKQDPNQGER